MTKKIIGTILVAAPFVLLFGIMIHVSSFVEVAESLAGAFLVLGSVLLGVWLIRGKGEA